MRILIVACCCLLLPAALAGDPAKDLAITTTAFKHGQAIPSKYTCKGEDVSPPLAFSNVPEGTRSLVLLVNDPDAPKKAWTHWLLYDIAPATTAIAEGATAGIPGKNSWGNAKWQGPCPPSGEHRYYFMLFALDQPLGLQPGAATADVIAAIKQRRILARAVVMGRFRK